MSSRNTQLLKRQTTPQIVITNATMSNLPIEDENGNQCVDDEYNISKSTNTVQVYCRLRGFDENQHGPFLNCVRLLSPNIMVLSAPANSKFCGKEVQSRFSHIFTAFSSQHDLFEHIAAPLLRNLIEGRNGLLFTYGVSGSGKTHTIAGDVNDPGIMPRSIYTLFNTIGEYQTPKYIIKSDRMNGFEIQTDAEAKRDALNFAKTSKKRRIAVNKILSYENDEYKIPDIDLVNSVFAIFVTYVEIYNKSVYDLLDETGLGKTLQNKIIREDAQKKMYVNGAIEVEVKTPEEAFEVFAQGQRRKRIANTVLNAESSRSHSIFTIRIVSVHQNCDSNHLIPESNELHVSQLSFVDLAGSERTNRTQHIGKTLKEASQINNSLMTLRNCLKILRENQENGTNSLVPYRDSHLTLFFKNYFEGDGNISMVVCINPTADDFVENLHVVKFAETSQDLRIADRPKLYNRTPCSTPRTPKSIKKQGAIATRKLKLVPTMSCFGPKLNFTLNLQSRSEFFIDLERLRNIAYDRQTKFTEFELDVEKAETHLRKRLQEVDQTQLLNRGTKETVDAQLKNIKQKNVNLEMKIDDLATENNDLQVKNKDAALTVCQLRATLYDKEQNIQRLEKQIDQLKDEQTVESEKKTHEMDKMLHRQRHYFEAKHKMQDDKIQKVKSILNEELKATVDSLDYLNKENCKKDDNVTTHIEGKSDSPSRAGARSRTPAISTPRSKRSRSAGTETWLEHNTILPVSVLRTVFQPQMRKRKSVTKLGKAADVTNPKQNKYCLIAQRQDLNGELETKLYKADIVSTCGGGAQVIFNDVERLRQKSPTE